MEYPAQLEGKSIYIDGELVKADQAHIHVMTHGLHYATAVFEGIRVYNGKPFLLKEHMDRLLHSASVLMLDSDYSSEDLCRIAIEIVEHNKIDFGYIRPFMWRGSEGLLIAGKGTKVHLAVAAWESFESEALQLKNIGVTLGYSRYPKPHKSSPFCGTKCSAVYALCHLMKKEALSLGLNDVIGLDIEGNVTEASSSNLFIIKDNKLYSPIPDCFLDGLTRQTIIKLAKENGIPFTECKLKKEDVQKADSVFICGTALGLLPVKSIEGKDFNTSHPLFASLSTLYDQLTSPSLH